MRAIQYSFPEPRFHTSSCRALVVDDEPMSARILESILTAQGVDAMSVSDPAQLASRLEAGHFEVVFLDYDLGDVKGLDLVSDMAARFPWVDVVLITAHGSIDLAVEAMRRGASGFVQKPFESAVIERELKRVRRPRAPRGLARDDDGADTGIVGRSVAVRKLHEQIHKMKDVDSTVLIIGESGTGKELIARALHTQSRRGRERFEAINCAAIPETLLEAQLFGYQKGAFTDAKHNHIGLFERCSSGTLFLDEIGEMPLMLQSKLLRVLQEKVVTPLGSSVSRAVNTRIVAATNRNLEEQVRNGAFRQDLYYRLSVLQIEAAPLRSRIEDVPDLVAHFVARKASDLSRKIAVPGPDVMARLMAYHWPGNIRELQNAIERAAILSEDGHLRIADMFPRQVLPEAAIPLNPMGGISEDLDTARDRFVREYLDRILKVTKGNVAQAARIAGRMRTDMYRLFEKHAIEPRRYKSLTTP